MPVETESQEFQMLPEYQQSYKTMDPKPWPETREFPDNATADVLKGWGKSSLPRGEYPCRKIVFTVKSGDQGWGGGAGRGTYNDSFTWFDTGLERVSAFRESKASFLAAQSPLYIRSIVSLAPPIGTVLTDS